MEHKEYIRINENADVAFLFIHGIVGTPNHFDEFVSMIPESFSVYNVLLDGHGKSAKNFSATSMKKWVAQVSSVVETLSSNHERIYVVAHSLGTLLAIEQAIRHPEICNLFLLAVPLCLFIKPKMMINSLKVYFNKIRPDDYEALAAKRCCGINADKNPLHYIGWIPRFLELFSKIRKTHRIISLLNIPCTTYQSDNDEMVSRRSIKVLSENPCIKVNRLRNSGHYYYDDADWNYMLEDFGKLLDLEKLG